MDSNRNSVPPQNPNYPNAPPQNPNYNNTNYQEPMPPPYEFAQTQPTVAPYTPSPFPNQMQPGMMYATQPGMPYGQPGVPYGQPYGQPSVPYGQPAIMQVTTAPYPTGTTQFVDGRKQTSGEEDVFPSILVYVGIWFHIRTLSAHENLF